MDSTSFGSLGSSIETGEITDGAVTSAKLNAEVSASLVPIGTIISWLKDFTSTPTLPDGWLECNGNAVNDTDSVYHGLTLPDLRNVFLRGAAASGATGGSDTHSHTITPTTEDNESQYTDNIYSPTVTGTSSTLPSYYSVVQIIKIK